MIFVNRELAYNMSWQVSMDLKCRDRGAISFKLWRKPKAKRATAWPANAMDEPEVWLSKPNKGSIYVHGAFHLTQCLVDLLQSHAVQMTVGRFDRGPSNGARKNN